MDFEDLPALDASFSRGGSPSPLQSPESQRPEGGRPPPGWQALCNELAGALRQIAALTQEAAHLRAEVARLQGERDQFQVLATQLQTALLSRVVIEQAKGMIAGDSGSDVDTAFAVMRKYARDHNERLHDVATSVVERRLSPRLLA